jgi:transcriptional regulator with XRE-family HTH domain
MKRRSKRHRHEPDIDALRLGRRVRQRRLELEYSFDAFVEELEMGRGYVSELERGLVVPSLTSLQKLAKVLDFTVADLVLGETERERLFSLTRDLEAHELNGLLATARRLVRSASSSQVIPFVKVTERARGALPLLALRPAAGAYSEPQPSEVLQWVRPQLGVGRRKGHFLARVEGSSMEPTIPAGAFGLFLRPWSPAPGQIGIFARFDSGDPEGWARYTVKEYRPRRAGDVVGGTLHPRNAAHLPLQPQPDIDEHPFALFVRVL